MGFLDSIKKAFGKKDEPYPKAFIMPANAPLYDINAYMPQTGRIIGEDGHTYNLVDLLMGASFGGNGGSNLIWRPNVTADGTITWTLSISQAPPLQQNIRGQPGTDGAPGNNGINGADGANGSDGREVQLSVGNDFIRWRYVGDAEWLNLVSLETLQGKPGTDGRDGVDGIAGNNGVDGINGKDGANGADGTDGREIELSINATHITWRYTGDIDWHNLIDLTSLQGADGMNGNDGVDGVHGETPQLRMNPDEPNVLQYKFPYQAIWTDLFVFSGIGNGITQEVLDGLAPLLSPALTGTPTAPTAGMTINDTQIATTAFVNNRIGSVLQTASVSVVDIANLQTEINALPKWLDRNITLQVRPGNTTLNIAITDFRGPGFLFLQTVNADGSAAAVLGQRTHTVNRIHISSNDNRLVQIRGFNCVQASGETIRFRNNKAHCIADFITAVSGTRETASYHGIDIRDNTGIVRMDQLDIANKAVAIYVLYSNTVTTRRITGVTGVAGGANTNTTGLYADYGANIQMYDATVPPSTAPRVRRGGGLLLGSNNEMLVFRPFTDANIDLGTTALRFRDLHLFRNIVQPTGTLNYEEGTWTPRLHGATTAGVMTYAQQAGFFIRIGNYVWVQCRIDLTARDATAVGSARIDGLPFRVRNLANTQTSHALQITRVPWEPGQIPYIHLPVNAFRVDINVMRPGTTVAVIPITSIAANSQIIFSACYLR